MIIKATNKLKGMLDLSSLERLQEENLQEAKTFHLTLHPLQQVEVDDQWYVIQNIQTALKDGYIEILDYKQQNPFIQEVSVSESTTSNYGFTLVEILNRADYPQDAFEKINENFTKIDSALIDGGLYIVNLLQSDSPYAPVKGCYLFCDASLGDVVINLGLASLYTSPITIKKIDMSLNKVIVNASGSEKIDGNSQLIIEFHNTSLSLVPYGFNWNIV